MEVGLEEKFEETNKDDNSLTNPYYPLKAVCLSRRKFYRLAADVVKYARVALPHLRSPADLGGHRPKLARRLPALQKGDTEFGIIAPISQESLRPLSTSLPCDVSRSFFPPTPWLVAFY